jgi:hypothetical protein
MGILNVNKIQPVGSGQTVTISANDINLQASTISANTFNGNVISAGISTFSGGIVISAGSTSSPSISPSGDSNTGIFFPADDTVSIVEGGVEVLRVNSSSNVGINSTSPQTKLDVVGGIRGTLILDTVRSATGTSIDFTDIPSWVKRITVMMNGTSLDATTPFLIRLGTSSGVVSSGYTSYWGYAYGPSTATAANTTGFGIHLGASSEIIWVNVMITNVTENTWLCSYGGALVTAPGGTGVQITGGGNVTLSGTLDRVRVTSVSGTASYDAGSVNIMYEG